MASARFWSFCPSGRSVIQFVANVASSRKLPKLWRLSWNHFFLRHIISKNWTNLPFRWNHSLKRDRYKLKWLEKISKIMKNLLGLPSLASARFWSFCPSGRSVIQFVANVASSRKLPKLWRLSWNHFFLRHIISKNWTNLPFRWNHSLKRDRYKLKWLEKISKIMKNLLGLPSSQESPLSVILVLHSPTLSWLKS